MKISKAKTILIKPTESMKDDLIYISNSTGILNIPDLIRFSLKATILTINAKAKPRQKGAIKK